MASLTPSSDRAIMAGMEEDSGYQGESLGQTQAGSGEDPAFSPDFQLGRELDLHTFLPGDIPGLVQEYLEEASRQGWKELRIIHGRGIGYQRQVVQKILGQCPLVASFRDDYDSRLGATWVLLL